MSTLVSKADTLLVMAQQIVERTPDFFTALGQGAGNIRSNVFMAELKKSAKETKPKLLVVYHTVVFRPGIAPPKFRDPPNVG